jgi:uncharacterized membrane protein (DUF485 family)
MKRPLGKRAPNRYTAGLMSENSSSPGSADHDFIHSEQFLVRLMRRQLGLSILCAAAFLLVLLGLPLLNYFVPDLMAARVGGFTISWLILGVLMFPYVWLISGYFIKNSLKMEADEAASVEQQKKS